MAIVRPAIVTLVLLLSITGTRLRAQSVDPKMSFVIDPNRPYVYLKFDHIGPGIPRDEREPKTRIWLRLTNNCRVAIIVSENGTPDGSPNDERQIMYEVVPSTVEPRTAIYEYWIGVTRTEERIQFDYEIVAITAEYGIARWWASFVRVPPGLETKLDGIFLISLDSAGRCQSLREWWHKQQ